MFLKFQTGSFLCTAVSIPQIPSAKHFKQLLQHNSHNLTTYITGQITAHTHFTAYKLQKYKRNCFTSADSQRKLTITKQSIWCMNTKQLMNNGYSNIWVYNLSWYITAVLQICTAYITLRLGFLIFSFKFMMVLTCWHNEMQVKQQKWSVKI